MASPADWVVARWELNFDGQLVPAGFDACVRVLHPATFEERPVTWREIAAHFGTVVHPRMEFDPITRRPHWSFGPEPEVFDRVPEMDWLPTELLPATVPILRRHTSAPERTWFAFWEGYAELPQSVRDAPAFRVPVRRYHLLHGTLDDAVGIEEPARGGYLRAALWWPDDRAWFLGSDTDLMSTYIAGSRGLADDLLASELEAHEVSTDTSFGARGDDVNPLEDRR